MSSIKTRILIMSDTHAQDLQAKTPSADVAIHCGDLTESSKLAEFHGAVRLLSEIDAPVKLVIAGNHDFTLDDAAFARMVAGWNLSLHSELVMKEFGAKGEARQILERVREHGILFLTEGNHEMFLENGAVLKIYSSPFTPGVGGWGFQYPLAEGHFFDIANDTHIAITHGPPLGIFDVSHGGERVGCPQLFTAIARSRPLIHAFGHIHEAWGAKVVAWQACIGAIEEPNHFNAIDNNRSVPIAKSSTFLPSRFDTDADRIEKATKLEHYKRNGCVTIDGAGNDERAVKKGEKTLFVNAAMEDEQGALNRLPYLVDVNLPKKEQ